MGHFSSIKVSVLGRFHKVSRQKNTTISVYPFLRPFLQQQKVTMPSHYSCDTLCFIINKKEQLKYITALRISKLLLLKKNLLFFFIVYKNEWKEYKF